VIRGKDRERGSQLMPILRLRPKNPLKTSKIEFSVFKINFTFAHLF
jgi:hypothetical protein